MEQRKEHSFEEICDTPKVNIREMREKIRAGVQIPKASSEKNTDVISFSDEELE
ncbi:MAG: hypothetical protein JSS30_04005 [Verrucomicrobia bacterium]|nr:hypothetical protein [Verrucomicrobiota bacterium]